METLHQKARTLQEGLLSAEDIAPARCAGDAVPSYLTWLEARLHGEPDETTWLAAQGLQQVLDAAMMFGVVIEEGHKVAPNTLAPDRHEAAVEAGLRIYAQGPKEIIKALDLIRESSPFPSRAGRPVGQIWQAL